MARFTRFEIRPHAPMQADTEGFIVRPRWRLIFQDQHVDECVTSAPEERAGNVQDFAASLKGRLATLSRRVMYPLRRAG